MPKIIRQFVLKNIVELCNQEGFLELSSKEIEELLALDELNVFYENNAFEIVLKWVNHDLEERQQYFSQLFSHVRLQVITIKHVLEIIAKNEFVKKFSDCRDLIEDAAMFYINPSVGPSQKPRNCEPDSLLLFSYKIGTPTSYNLASENWKYLPSGKSPNILKDCAVTNYYHSTTVFCGGIDLNKNFSNQVVKFDGFRWMTLSSLNVARCGVAAVFQGSKLYVLGDEMLPVPNDKTFQCTKTNPSTFFFAKSFEIWDKSWKQAYNELQVSSYFASPIMRAKFTS